VGLSGTRLGVKWEWTGSQVGLSGTQWDSTGSPRLPVGECKIQSFSKGMGMGKEIPAHGKHVPVAGTCAYFGNIFVSDNSLDSRTCYAHQHTMYTPGTWQLIPLWQNLNIT